MSEGSPDLGMPGYQYEADGNTTDSGSCNALLHSEIEQQQLQYYPCPYYPYQIPYAMGMGIGMHLDLDLDLDMDLDMDALYVPGPQTLLHFFPTVAEGTTAIDLQLQCNAYQSPSPSFCATAATNEQVKERRPLPVPIVDSCVDIDTKTATIETCPLYNGRPIAHPQAHVDTLSCFIADQTENTTLGGRPHPGPFSDRDAISTIVPSIQEHIEQKQSPQPAIKLCGDVRYSHPVSRRPHVCTHQDFPHSRPCGRTFERREHLTRHTTMHLPSAELPYHCFLPGCKKRFGRPDNAADHFKTHLRPPSKGKRNKHCDWETLECYLKNTYTRKQAKKLLHNLEKWRERTHKSSAEESAPSHER